MMTKQNHEHPETSDQTSVVGVLRTGVCVLVLAFVFYLLIAEPLGIIMEPVSDLLGSLKDKANYAIQLFSAVAALIGGIGICSVIRRPPAAGQEKGGSSRRRRVRVRDVLSLLPMVTGAGLGLVFLVMSVVKRISDGFWPGDLAFGVKMCPFAGLFVGLFILSFISLFVPGEKLTRRRSFLLLLVLLYIISPKVSTTWLIESGLVREWASIQVKGIYLHDKRIVVDYHTTCTVRDGLFADKKRRWEAERWGSLPLESIVTVDSSWGSWTDGGFKMYNTCLPGEEYEVKRGSIPDRIREQATMVPYGKIDSQGALGDRLHQAKTEFGATMFMLEAGSQALLYTEQAVGADGPCFLSINLPRVKPWVQPQSYWIILAGLPVAVVMDAIAGPFQWLLNIAHGFVLGGALGH